MIQTKTDQIEIQIGFRLEEDVFVRVRDSMACELIKFPGGMEFLKTTYLQPGAMDRVPSDALVRVLDEVDPVFGIGAPDGKPLLLRREKDEG
jgi:hypothetical protein